MRWPRRRNGWAVLAETCERSDASPLQRAIMLGMNVLATNTALAGKMLVIDRAALDEIPRMSLPQEDATEFGVRVPFDLRWFQAAGR